MKKTILFFLLIPALTLHAQDADKIISEYVEAIGGKAKIEAITSMKVTATVKQGGMDIPGVIYRKRPNMSKMEFTLQGMTQHIGFDGTEGWMINPFQGRTIAEKMDSDGLKTTRYESEFDDPLMNYAKHGHKVTYIGEEDADGSPAHHVQLTTKEGDVYDYYFDKDAYLLVKQKQHVKSQDGTTTDSEVNYSDYKEVNGVLMAFTIEQVQDYQGQKYSTFIKFDNIEPNVAIDDTIFKMPK